MALQRLSPASILGPGSDIWMIPDIQRSTWSRKIDWYLNLRLAHTQLHEPHRRNAELESILNENDMTIPEHGRNAEAATLLAPHQRLPCKQVVVIPSRIQPEAWILACYEVWSQLGKCSVRLFLPPKITAEHILKYWPGASSVDGLSFLAEDETKSTG